MADDMTYQGLKRELDAGIDARLNASAPASFGIAPNAESGTSPNMGMGGGEISRPLQDLIDKVSGMQVSRGRKVAALTRLAGVVGGIQREKMQSASNLAQANIMTQPRMLEAAKNPNFTSGFLNLKIGENGGRGIGQKGFANERDWWNSLSSADKDKLGSENSHLFNKDENGVWSIK